MASEQGAADRRLVHRLWRVVCVAASWVVGAFEAEVHSYWYGMDWLPLAWRVSFFAVWLGILVARLALGRMSVELVVAGVLSVGAGCVLAKRSLRRDRRVWPWLTGVARLAFWMDAVLYVVVRGASILHRGLYFWRAR